MAVITVHLANAAERLRADALVRRVYAVQGLGDHGVPAGGDTFIACSGSHMVGTLTLVVDAHEGLPADSLFHEDLDRLRASGARLCELTRFVLETQAPSAKVFHDLFHAIHRHGVSNYDCTDLVVQADPSHCVFYRRRLGFKPLGLPLNNPQYNAPAQLMRIHVTELDRHFYPSQHAHLNAKHEHRRLRTWMAAAA